MRIFEWLEEWLVWGARLGALGEKWWGRLVAPLIAVPIVLAGRFIYTFSVDLFYIVLFLFILNFVIAVHLAFSDLPIERHKEIVLPSIAGMMLGFFYAPPSFEMVFWGFLIFTGLSQLVPRFLRTYREEEFKLSLFTGVTGLFVDDFVVGFFTCVLLHLLNVVIR